MRSCSLNLKRSWNLFSPYRTWDLQSGELFWNFNACPRFCLSWNQKDTPVWFQFKRQISNTITLRINSLFLCVILRGGNFLSVFFAAGVNPNYRYAVPPPLKSGHIGIKDAQWAESCEKKIPIPNNFSILYSKFLENWPQKLRICSEAYGKSIFRILQFLFFETWSILYSTVGISEIFASLIQKR